MHLCEKVTELPYRPDSADWFDALADRPWSMFLDSGRSGGAYGRYDILVYDPVATLVTRGAVTQIRYGEYCEHSRDDPLTLLRRALARHEPVGMSPAAVPFTGGAVGYFGYDLGRGFDRLPQIATDPEQSPTMAVGIYDSAIVVDHVTRRSLLIGRQCDAFSPETHRHRAPLRAVGRIDTTLARDAYGVAFRRVIDYIRAGDCYQVNLARRFSARVDGDAWAGYRRLRVLSSAPYSAYLNLPSLRVLSVSPERFLHLRDGVVQTRPIKGTRPRHADADADRRLAQELLVSAKDRAENVMIVDLLRNDLGKVCVPGSVSVEALCALESFSTVHHLVSTVTGRTAPGVHALDVLRACFPGGSITGAPKIRAMQIIEDLERERRGVYCGAIGYIGFDGTMDMNVAIRTLVHRADHVRFWAGGGIVADSDVEQEFQETLDKSSAMFRLLA